ncbi:unnamed protein product [Strongylus vulgaris]|uniref:Uncharacterized protein n=1 Tax=Strongylus vulgaris TaxID=40348 RepID=A0A3P7KU67_STRVU|nr:unnamed protein product [Strongylus vulgaris]
MKNEEDIDEPQQPPLQSGSIESQKLEAIVWTTPAAAMEITNSSSPTIDVLSEVSPLTQSSVKTPTIFLER